MPILALLFLGLAPVSRAQVPAQMSDSAAIAALIKQVEAANNVGDAERWVSLFGDDFVYMAPGAPAVTTRSALLDVARTGFRNRASVIIQPVEITVLGSWAFARNAVRGHVTLAGSGRVVSVDVKQLVVYRREDDGRWRIARFSSNSNTQ